MAVRIFVFLAPFAITFGAFYISSQLGDIKRQQDDQTEKLQQVTGDVKVLNAKLDNGVIWRITELERQLAELSDLADIGMDIARGLRRMVAEAAEQGAQPVDHVAVTLAFSRVSRAVRLTFALQTLTTPNPALGHQRQAS